MLLKFLNEYQQSRVDGIISILNRIPKAVNNSFFGKKKEEEESQKVKTMETTDNKCTINLPFFN